MIEISVRAAAVAVGEEYWTKRKACMCEKDAMIHVGCDMKTTGERERLMKNSTVQKGCEVRCKMEQKGKQEIRVQMGE